MPTIAETIANLSANLNKAALRVGKLSQSGTVLVAASILDTELERALKATMRPLDKKMNGRLFKSYGPLSTFSGKIDLAYAMRITTLEIHNELHKIRDIRNAFAHTVSVQTMESEEVRPLFNKLKKPTNTDATSMLDVFLGCVAEIDSYLENYLISMGITDDLSKRARATLKEEL